MSRRRTWTIGAALIATLINMEADPMTWVQEDRGSFKRSKKEIFEYVIRPSEVREYAPIFYRVEEIDSHPFGVGKKYRTTSSVFIDFESEFRITELSRRKNRIVVESDDYFRPVIAVEAIEWESKKSRDDDTYDKQRDAYGCVLKISVHYNRKSVLFQYTVAPLLQYITQQHIRHALFVLNWLIPQTRA